MLRLILSLTLFIFSLSAFGAKKVEVNTAKSSINWKGWKIVKTADSHTGTVELGPSFLMIEKDKIVGGTIMVDMSTIKNEDLKDKKKNAYLVSHLESEEFFHTKAHKDATFVIKTVKKLKADNKYEFIGDLIIRGKKEEDKSISAVVTKKDNVWSAKGKLTFDRSKFDVKYNSKTFFPNLWKTAKEKVISNDIELTFNLVTIPTKKQ